MYMRGDVQSGSLNETQERYRGLAHQCISQRHDRVMIVGSPGNDAWAHVVVKDVIYSIAVAGVPEGFRLALVSGSPELAAIYDAAAAYAKLRGLDVKRYSDEASAAQWLDG
jgi:hypothetical protein